MRTSSRTVPDTVDELVTVSRPQNPGIDLLRLLAPWAAGARLAAGACLLSAVRPVTRLVAEVCRVDSCGCWVCGASDADLAEHRVAHVRRCHGDGVRGAR